MDIIYKFLEEYTQLFGLIGAFIGIIKFQFKSPQSIKMSMAVISVFFFLHYIGLGYESVAFLCVLGFLRSSLLSTNIGMHHRIKIASIGIGLAISSTLWVIIWNNESWVVGFTALGFTLNMLAEIQHSGLKMRITYLSQPLSAIIFHLSTMSYGGILANIGSIISNAIGIYRHHYRKKKVA